MKNNFVIKFILFVLISGISVAAIAFFLGELDLPGENARMTLGELPPLRYTTVIIDAGHGGEDGGTSSAAGLVEKDVNLDIALRLKNLLESAGVNVVLTRSDDRLLYDRNIDYQGRKKKLDLAARLEIMESAPDAIFVSIHMNSFTDKSCSGLQVWYSKNDPISSELAKTIQSGAAKDLGAEGVRVVKEATSAIAILDRATCPAVLVECGFLSNPDEAAKFATAEYRQQNAEAISDAIIAFLRDTE